MSKLIVNAKNLKGGRSQDLYCLSQETVEFVNSLQTHVRGQKLEVVAKVAKSNFAAKTVTTEDGKTFKVLSDKSVVEKI